jgi:hypothetical protein
MKTFKEWLKLKEGLWLSDDKAEETSGGVEAPAKSKRKQPAAMGGMGAAGAAGPAGGQLGGMALQARR